MVYLHIPSNQKPLTTNKPAIEGAKATYILQTKQNQKYFKRIHKHYKPQS